MTPTTNGSLIDDELREEHAKSALARAASSTSRLPCTAPAKTHSIIGYIGGTLLLDMIRQAQNNYRNGYLADCTVDVEFLHDRRRELIEYCWREGLKLPDNRRDSSGNAPVGDWIALAMTHLAWSSTITIRSFEEGMDNVPHIILTLS